MTTEAPGLSPRQGDALIIVDLQNDFLPGGNLAVADGNEIVPLINLYIERFLEAGLPVFATRDWHPADHCSFEAQGGPWPPHCIADTTGAAFAPELLLPKDATIISKATTAGKDAYSGFEGTDLAGRLREAGVERVFVGGLATDYCVLNTVQDALKEGFQVVLLKDAVRAVNVQPDDGRKAEATMESAGATPATLEMLGA